MFLSRLILNPLHRDTARLLRSPYDVHVMLCNLFPEPERERLLFRIEEGPHGEPTVLFQSQHHEPEWGELRLAPNSIRQAESERLQIVLGDTVVDEGVRKSVRLLLGQRLGFRLLCRPSIRQSGDFGLKSNGKRRPGQRVTKLTDEEKLDWLKRKGHEHGFNVEAVGLTYCGWWDSKDPQARKGSEPLTNEAKERFRSIKIGAVRFEGTLVVTAPDRLREAVRNGIGQQKAYGFGLLSLAPLR